ncbi:hypothetical protein EMPS_00006 [Entomortierella parvispora]|uniref:Crinkler (CRN) family protein n=1 Tax=Entomortierella parvispora TaxID=205924 RepID=A0A9P3LRK5_9FUNG|nr:hypothetical protein EMPS_00006 [Entomortierella parvispora]
MKQAISQAFPRGLPYRNPPPLLRTTGMSWTYQPDPKLYGTLRRSIKDHYSDFFKGLRDKSTIPLYLFLCGAGTGKSRNAQEFHQSATLCLTEEEDQELRSKIEHAWVFHVSLENRASPLEKEVYPIEAIGTRMLLQLLPDKRVRDVMQDYKEVHPMDVLDLVARGTGRDLRSATVILVVDGLQSFMTHPKDGHSKDSAFYRALTNIVALSFEDVFLMACCTGTITTLVDKASGFTHWNRVVLPVASLKPPFIYQNGSATPVFDEDDHITKVLVTDCGGHGRALEALQQVIEAAGRDFNVDSLMNSLYHKLKDLYSEALSIPPSTVQAMARAILTRAYLDPDQPLLGSGKLPGELATPGLIRYEQPHGLGSGGYLTAPYIWVWLFSYQPTEDVVPPLINWRFCDYSDLKSKTDPGSPPGAQFWQHFEHFLATFRCLKSQVLGDGEPTTISAIHTGARLRGDIHFKNHHLKVAVSSKQVDTKSTIYERMTLTIHCEHQTLSIRRFEHCIINAPSAPYGDSFTGLDTQGFHTGFRMEVHQCKLIADGGGIDYQAERKKAASDRDFFIMFTSKDQLEVDLPPLSGIVDGSNWALYFGPFAGRAFVFATTGALDINRAQRKDLKRIRGIDETKADLIINERTKRRFDSYEDATQRLRGVDDTVLRRFKFSRTA